MKHAISQRLDFISELDHAHIPHQARASR